MQSMEMQVAPSPIRFFGLKALTFGVMMHLAKDPGDPKVWLNLLNHL